MNLIYHGDVEITINHKSHKIKNHGTEHLFRMFVSMLNEGSIASANLPLYVMLYKKNAESIENDPYTSRHQVSELLTKYVILHKYVVNEDNVHSIIFDATITPEYKNGVSVNSTDPISLALISQDTLSILAVVTFENDKYDYLSAGNSAVIKWTMTLQNES